MPRSNRWMPLAFALPTLTLAATSPATAQEPSDCAWCAEARALVERFGLREAATPARESEGWAPPERIVTFYGEEFAEEFRRIAPDAEVVAVNDPAAAAAAVVGADVYIGFCRPEAVAPSSTLRWLHQLPAGVDGCVDLPGISDGRILLTNGRGMFSPQIADHAMGLLLALTRRVGRYHVQQRAGAWSHPVADVHVAVDSTYWELEGKTMLVLGLGGIGTEVARRAHAFGMRVHATRNTSREGPDFVDYVGLADETLDLASQADVIVNALPLTLATRELIDAEFFRTMKPTAYLINVGRGEAVVTADLGGSAPAPRWSRLGRASWRILPAEWQEVIPRARARHHMAPKVRRRARHAASPTRQAWLQARAGWIADQPDPVRLSCRVPSYDRRSRRPHVPASSAPRTPAGCSPP